MINISFLNGIHEARFNECIKRDETGSGDVERIALFYILSGNSDIWSKGIDNIYCFKENGIKINSLKKLFLCSSSNKLVKLAFNLYNGIATKNMDPRSLFSSLDNDNLQLVINSLKIRF